MSRFSLAFFAASGLALTLGGLGCSSIQQKTMFFPSHNAPQGELKPWYNENNVIIGWVRPAERPHCLWLLLHGNAGQAEDRTYALHAFSPEDSVFILEYPGYGQRKGPTSVATLSAAAVEGYRVLRRTYGSNMHVCVAGESLGSGPACALAQESTPPDKIVLVVPFDTLASVGADHVPASSANVVMASAWNNIASLKGYRGPLEIFAAQNDEVIPPYHAQALADSVPGVKWHVIPGGHNDWSRQAAVQFRYP